MTNRVGFHFAPGGNANGIGAHFAAMDAAGVPCVLTSYDDYGVCGELASYTNAPHVIAFRPTVYPENPDYDLPADVAAAELWGRLAAKLPPEFNKERVWLLWGNEGRKEVEYGDWWGNVAVGIASLAKKAGIKTLAFSFSAGTPEEEVWQSAGMLAYLAWCANNTGWGGIALHEGADPRYGGPGFGPLVNDVGWIAGRYRHIFEACASNHIARPPILITECAWKYNNAPDTGQAMSDIAEAQTFYDTDGVMGFCLWSLTGPGGGGEYGQVSNKVQALIEPVTQYAIAHKDDAPPTPQPPPGTEPMPTTLEQHLIDTAAARPHFNNDAALQKAINATPGLRTLTLEGRTNFDGTQYAFQEACDQYDTVRTLFYCAVGDWDNIKTVEYPGPNQPPALPPNRDFPFWMLRVGRPLESYVLTSVYGAPRDYDRDGVKDDRHEGIDLAAPTNTPIHAVYDGMVIKKSFSPSGWGNYIVLQHDINGFVWMSVYAHMVVQSTLNVGQAVAKGEVIGLVGSTGNSSGPHLHLTFQAPGFGDNGGGFLPTVPDCFNPYPYIDFNTPNIASAGQKKYDLALYLRGNRAVTLRNMDGQQEHVYYPDIPGVDGGWYIAKNSLYEELRARAATIDRRVDTSPGNGRSYCQFTNGAPPTPWAPWARRNMAVGELFSRNPVVVFKDERNCATVNSYIDPSQLLLFAHHDKWSDPNTARTFDDVIELRWIANGALVEKYFAARGVGYIRFEAPGAGYSSWVHEIHTTNTGDPVRPSPCWQF